MAFKTLKWRFLGGLLVTTAFSSMVALGFGGGILAAAVLAYLLGAFVVWGWFLDLRSGHIPTRHQPGWYDGE